MGRAEMPCTDWETLLGGPDSLHTYVFLHLLYKYLFRAKYA